MLGNELHTKNHSPISLQKQPPAINSIQRSIKVWDFLSVLEEKAKDSIQCALAV